VKSGRVVWLPLLRPCAAWSNATTAYPAARSGAIQGPMRVPWLDQPCANST
jgi:hypothetical protein